MSFRPVSPKFSLCAAGVYQYTTRVRLTTLAREGDCTGRPGGLYARLCHALFSGGAVMTAVADVPRHGPQNVTVETGTTTATISWRPGFDAGHPLHHVVWSVSHSLHSPAFYCPLLVFVSQQRRPTSTKALLKTVNAYRPRSKI